MNRVYQIKVIEKKAKPPVWYVIAAAGNMTFAELGSTIERLLGAVAPLDHEASTFVNGKAEMSATAALRDFFEENDWLTFNCSTAYRVEVAAREEENGEALPRFVKRSKGAEALDKDAQDLKKIEAAVSASAPAASEKEASAPAVSAPTASTNEVSAETVAAVESAVEASVAAVAAAEPTAEDAMRLSWLRECLEVVPLFYGSIPMNTFNLIVGTRTEMSVIDMEMMIRALPEELNPCVIAGDRLVAKDFYENDLYKKLDAQQGSKPFYIPTKQEIVEMSAEGYPATAPAWRDLYIYIVNACGLDPEEAAGLMSGIWYAMSLGETPGKIMGMLVERGALIENASEEAITLADKLVSLMNNTRMMLNRGFTPAELAVQSRRQAFDKKIYPNDKCPCGSGKKYKHCHGRK